MTTQSLHPVQTLLRPGVLVHPLRWHVNRTMLFVVSVLVCLAFLVGWTYLKQQSQTATLNNNIENYRDDINRLNHLNADIEAQIATATQLKAITQRANELGFGPAENNVYLLVPDYPVESAVSWQVNPLSGTR